MTDNPSRPSEQAGAAPPAETRDVRRIVADLLAGHPFAVLTWCSKRRNAAKNATRNDKLEQSLCRLNFGYLNVKGSHIAENDEIIEDGVLVIGDAFLENNLFRRIIENLAEQLDMDTIVIGSGRDEVVRVAARATTRGGGDGRLWRFVPARVQDHFGERAGRPFALRSSGEEHVARTRRAMGWSGGFWVQTCRAEAARRPRP